MRMPRQPSPASAPPRTPTLGSAPQALLSSRPLAWTGIVVELYRVCDVDYIVTPSEHVVSLFLRGSVDLLQQRSGREVQRVMRAGDIIVMPAGEPKRICHHGPAEILKLKLAPAFVEGVAFDGVALRHPRFDLLDNFGTRDPRLEATARQLLDECSTQGLASHVYADALANQLAIHLLRNHSTAAVARECALTSLPPYRLRRALDYIHEHLADELTLARIAATLAMSPCHFAHEFRRAVGVAPHQYILDQRVQRAKRLLRDTDLPLIEIAHRVGCSSPSHFSVLFRRATGYPPKHYRNKA